MLCTYLYIEYNFSVAAFQISRYKSPGLDCAYYGGVGKLGGYPYIQIQSK